MIWWSIIAWVHLRKHALRGNSDCESITVFRNNWPNDGIAITIYLDIFLLFSVELIFESQLTQIQPVSYVYWGFLIGGIPCGPWCFHKWGHPMFPNFPMAIANFSGQWGMTDCPSLNTPPSYVQASEADLWREMEAGMRIGSCPG